MSSSVTATVVAADPPASPVLALTGFETNPLAPTVGENGPSPADSTTSGDPKELKGEVRVHSGADDCEPTPPAKRGKPLRGRAGSHPGASGGGEVPCSLPKEEESGQDPSPVATPMRGSQTCVSGPSSPTSGGVTNDDDQGITSGEPVASTASESGASTDPGRRITGRMVWQDPDNFEPHLRMTDEEAAEASKHEFPAATVQELKDFRTSFFQAQHLANGTEAVMIGRESSRSRVTCHVLKGPFNVVSAADGVDLVYRLRFQEGFYEGDAASTVAGEDKQELRPHGYGSACFGPEAREIFRGKFTGGVTGRNDRHRSGAEAGWSVPDLCKLYLTQVGVWVRVWFADTSTTAKKFFEVRRDSWIPGRTYCIPAAQMTWPKEAVIHPGQHYLGKDIVEREWSVPPSVVAWLSASDRPRLPWNGGTRDRPRSVRMAVPASKCKGPNDGLEYHTDWASAESSYPWYECIQLRAGKNAEGRLPRHLSLDLAYGVWDCGASTYRANLTPEAYTSPCAFPDDMVGGSLYKMYEWGGVLTARNAVAVMFSTVPWDRGPKNKPGSVFEHKHDDQFDNGHKQGPPFTGAHASCQVFFSAHPGSGYGPDKLEHNRFACLFSGRPIGMPPKWAQSYFGDQWSAALQSPNVPVMLHPVRSRTPELNHRVLSLLDPFLLVQLQKVDDVTKVRVPGVASRVSTCWSGLDVGSVFGFSPVTSSLLRLGFGDRYHAGALGHDAGRDPITARTEGKGVGHVKPLDWESLTPGLPLLALKAKEGNAQSGTVWPTGKNAHPRKDIYLADSPKVAVVKNQCLMNLKALVFVNGCGKGPFKIAFHAGGPLHGDGNLPTSGKMGKAPGGAKDMFTEKLYSVSFAYLLKYYHPHLLRQAVEGIFCPEAFVAGTHGNAQLVARPPGAGATVKIWNHGRPMKIDGVGNSVGGEEASCARGAVAGLLAHFLDVGVTRDAGAIEKVHREWPAWVDWKLMPPLVHKLHSSSTAQRRYRLFRFREEPDAEKTGRTPFALALSPLGRARLFEYGVRHVLLRPVKASGYAGHAVAIAATHDGVWYMVDPDDGGADIATTRLRGSLPGVRYILAAYALLSESTEIGVTLAPELRYKYPVTTGNASSGPKKVKRSFALPCAPTPQESNFAYRLSHLVDAVEQCVLHTAGLTQSGPGIIDVLAPTFAAACLSMQGGRNELLPNHLLWGKLVGKLQQQPKHLSQEYSLDDITAVGLAVLRAGRRGGSDTGTSTVLVVESQRKGGIRLVPTLVVVVLTAHRHAYYCPHDGCWKDVTMEALGLRGNDDCVIFRVGATGTLDLTSSLDRFDLLRVQPHPEPGLPGAKDTHQHACPRRRLPHVHPQHPPSSMSAKRPRMSEDGPVGQDSLTPKGDVDMGE